MNKIFLSLIAILCSLPPMAVAQPTPNTQVGKISLIPFLKDSYDQQVNTLLINKLQQIATQNGMAGAGFDDRFIITAHLHPISAEKTATIPSKSAVKLSVALYIGDGFDGTLFSSMETELKGVGKDDTQAYMNAVRRLSPTNVEVQAFVKKGCDRIVAYYDNISPSIISRAKALAKSSKHDEAIVALLAIPSSSKSFEQAQSLIAEYGKPALENRNLELINQARATWSASPTESGASQARQLLCGINYPSINVQRQARELTSEMSAHLKQEQKHQWELLMQESQNWHERQMERIEGEIELEKARIESDRDQRVATILGAAQVEAAWASRPIVNYTVNWW